MPKKCLFIVGLWVLLLGAHAQTSSLAKTKIELKQLESKISHVQNTLTHAHNKSGVLHQELLQTEKKINDDARQLHTIQSNMNKTRDKIAHLQRQVDSLNKALRTQQDLLAKQVRARYMMGEYQPLKWLLNQDDPSSTSRLLTFHTYIVSSRQHMIDNVHQTEGRLTQSQEKLRLEIDQQRQLQNALNKHQQTLAKEKRYHTNLLESLNKEISNQQHVLNDYQRNKENLSRLINTLIQQSVVRPRYPFFSMRKKLQRPIPASIGNLRAINQGIIIFAPEGTPVSAVYPGKVVFSDWLNGYGLLLILDHGQGFMTLYAHNQSLLRHKGEIVNQGEKIAFVGHSGGIKQNGLYFEIRQRGKAIPPLKWLSGT